MPKYLNSLITFGTIFLIVEIGSIYLTVVKIYAVLFDF
jgi:hypothetical protein